SSTARATTVPTKRKAASRVASSAPTCTGRCYRRTRTSRITCLRRPSGDGATARFRRSTTRRSWPRTAGSCSARNDGSPGSVAAVQNVRPPRHQRLAQHLIDRLDHHELHLLAQIGRDIVKVGLVVRGHEYAPQSGAVGAEYLLLDAPDRQHLAT